ncbi:MAG: hypothetical protein LKI18_00985 [Prevotella sp.]|nr:hypothetical protein [Prevotella sp.]
MTLKYEVACSKPFIKASKKLSGKMLESLKNTITEVKNAQSIEKITDCIRLSDYKNVYRIRIGNYRAFFISHIEIVDDMVFFQYLMSLGQAYSKEVLKNLRDKDI